MDVIEVLLQRTKSILEKNGAKVVVVMQPNGQGIEKIISHHDGFEISTVAFRYVNPDVLAAGAVGELWTAS
jgi:hypothetical protein